MVCQECLLDCSVRGTVAECPLSPWVCSVVNFNLVVSKMQNGLFERIEKVHWCVGVGNIRNHIWKKINETTFSNSDYQKGYMDCGNMVLSLIDSLTKEVEELACKIDLDGNSTKEITKQ